MSIETMNGHTDVRPNLTIDEVATLAECEGTIAAGLTTFYDVGGALLTVRDGRLYREAYDTFEDYCLGKWNMSRPRAYQFIDAAFIVRDLSTNVDMPLPQTEGQARALAPVKDAEERREVWASAVAASPKGQPTERQVRQAKAAHAAKKRTQAAAARAKDMPQSAPVRTRYGVILIDPPWEYNNSGVEGAAAREYGTIGAADLAKLPLRDMAAPDSVLILWATWPQLAAAMGLIAAWGYEYVTGMPWIKTEGEHPERPKYGTGWWVRGCSEPILIARRGNATLPTGDWVGIISPAFRHSKKPETIYDYAESFPGPFCEVFARASRDGWVSLGDEIDGKDIREAMTEVIG